MDASVDRPSTQHVATGRRPVVPDGVLTPENQGLYSLHLACTEASPEQRIAAAEAVVRAGRLLAVDELRTETPSAPLLDHASTPARVLSKSTRAAPSVRAPLPPTSHAIESNASAPSLIERTASPLGVSAPLVDTLDDLT
jgi:hypothetical protein